MCAVLWIMALTLPVGGLVDQGWLPSQSRATVFRAEVADRDKTGTSVLPRNSEGSQMLDCQAVASLVFLQAEGTRFELATPFGAPHFQCGR
jgi:hypothetical protein